MIDPITVDFETDGIEGNPLTNPPKPCGVAVWVPGSEPSYMAWGHPTENNCTYATAHEYLERLVKSGRPLLFHNAPFDMTVWESHFCNARFPWAFEPIWKRIHDTTYLLFLDNPYSQNLSLKPNAASYLGMEPDEQDELFKWILQNVPGSTRKSAGAYISRAPGDLVAEYAVGDVVRTRKLFDLLHPKICELGMEPAYDRERRLNPILVRGTRRGIRVDRHTLVHHEKAYSSCLEVASSRLASQLECSVDALDSDELLADALDRTGLVTQWVLTEKSGKRSMSKENLKINDPEVKNLMTYRGAISTCLQTFMRPWIEKSASDGRLHPNWNQVRQPKDDRQSKGARTGRLSSDDPNFQNVPAIFTDKEGNPLEVPYGLHPYPTMRAYCLPDEGHLWIKRDFSSQEIRILAHFEDGRICQMYKLNPMYDPHKDAQGLIEALINILYSRKEIKITGFSIIYGSGYSGLAAQLGQPYESAFKIKNAYLAVNPSIRELMEDVQRRGKSGQPIRTWGGRLYYVEPSRVVKGRFMDFAYKLLNYLIQGSAADHTKEAICDWEDTRKWSDTFLATVHDEVNISAPVEDAPAAMRRLREAMDKDRFDVPIRSEGFIGKNWHEIEEFDDTLPQ